MARRWRHRDMPTVNTKVVAKQPRKLAPNFLPNQKYLSHSSGKLLSWVVVLVLVVFVVVGFVGVAY